MKHMARIGTVTRAALQRLGSSHPVDAFKLAAETRLVQQRLCRDRDVPWTPPIHGAIVGVARNVGTGTWPVNGLRHPMEGTTCGWYLWAGDEEMDQSPDYFEPVHLEHLHDRCPEVIPFLGLPPGWRFLVSPEDSEVWEDPDLLILED
jgi:hypothetical protein